MTSILGIDPGASGGVALLSSPMEEVVSSGELRWDKALGTAVWKMPETERDLWDLLDMLDIDHAYIEAVHSMPGQGVASTFKFGQNYGMLRGFLIALGIPFETVAPHKWQQALGCLTHGDKNISKAKAQELFPSLKITHATADALLICEYGRRQQSHAG